MKILLSAYACEPNKGSEPGVGWHWAIGLAQLGHDVWVLTRANNKQTIEKEYSEHQQPNNLHFIYYDLSSLVRRWKQGNRWIHLYYLFWQVGAYKIAKKIHAKIKFNLVHHITFGVVRQPSFMGGLGIPFLFGPIGGGERAPLALRAGYSMRGKLLDIIRDFFNAIIKFDPMMWYTFKTAEIIYVKTPETMQVIPQKFHKKVTVQLELGFDFNQLEMLQPPAAKEGALKVLFVGRFIYWKGMHLGLAAFARLLEKYPNGRLTMVGKGPEEIAWKKLANGLAIRHAVNWISWVHQKELKVIYQGHNVLLFPSLHDSSGNVVLESMANGLPVVCLDLGGPGVIVNDSCGIKINTLGKTEKQVIEELSLELVRLAKNFEILKELSFGAIKRAYNFNWEKLVSSVYGMYQ